MLVGQGLLFCVLSGLGFGFGGAAAGCRPSPVRQPGTGRASERGSDPRHRPAARRVNVLVLLVLDFVHAVHPHAEAGGPYLEEIQRLTQQYIHQ